MIGVFDSGIGGLTILRALRERLPTERFCYLGDNAYAPYGARPADEIYALTRRGIDRLFREGCGLVVLACNTAAAVALRRLQQEWLPAAWPDRNVLGVFAPVVESLSGQSWSAPGPTRYSTPRKARTVALFATRTTIQSDAFGRELRSRTRDLSLLNQACPRLAQAIEESWADEDIDRGVARYVGALMAKAGGAPVDLAVLGCTHYPLVQDVFARHLPPGVTILDQPRLCAEGLADYLTRKPQFARSEDEPAGALSFLTSGDPDAIAANAARFYGEACAFGHISAPPTAPPPAPIPPQAEAEAPPPHSSPTAPPAAAPGEGSSSASSDDG
ncbi:MAG: aspartate/glutamate racemase family protein [Marivibrio sp.]|uniref:glutamate racemase n=1 Tax=Marivibrio sp. TaxID=2039719 RepID=UPI0032ED477C